MAMSQGGPHPLPMPSPSFAWSLLQPPSRTPDFSEVQICDASPLLELCLSFSRLAAFRVKSKLPVWHSSSCMDTSSDRQRQAWSWETGVGERLTGAEREERLREI